MSINTNSTDKELPTLERLPDTTRHQFEAPSKKINDGDDLSFFFTSTAYRDLTKWLLQLNRSMFPVKGQDGKPKPRELDSSHQFSSHIQKLRQLLESLSDFIQQAPPDTGPRRFGNVAFRTWYNLADEHADALLRKHLDGVVPLEIGNGTMVQELKSYLLGGFGSAQRLDYGTGHELSFLAFLACLWKLGAFVDGEDSMIVIGIIQPYLELVRELILTYTLEPAGSHGVWGLDDHSFIPYIFGSAQFGPAISQDDYSTPVPMEGSLPTSPSPSSVTSKAMVGDFKDSNMYFSAIQFIYDVKKGPFWEHSPVLYDISGIKDGWGKINKGMLKMYAAEVLGKFPVVQHFPFGSLFRWERDANAVQSAPTAHAQHQPSAPQSKDVPPAAGGRTSAPWARSTTTMPQMQSSTGMPSTRAPWASGGMPGRAGQATAAAAAAAAAAGSTTAPWASSQRQNQAGVESTAAPWAKKDSAG